MGSLTGAALLAGGTLLGANEQRKASKRAEKAQKEAAAQSVGVQEDALRQFRMASEPFRFAGQQAVNPLLMSLGISPIGVPQQPVFGMLSGQPAQQAPGRRAEIESRLAELRKAAGGSDGFFHK